MRIRPPMVVVSILCAGAIAGPILAQNTGPVYIPIVTNPQPTPTLPPTVVPTVAPTRVPTAAPTAAPTRVPTAAPVPTATPAPLPPSFNSCRADPSASRAPNYPVRIVTVDKSAESVTLRNVSTAAIDLDGWTMCSITGNQTHDGVGGTLGAGQTNTYPYSGAGNIWNNSNKDDGALYDTEGRLASYWVDPD